MPDEPNAREQMAALHDAQTPEELLAAVMASHEVVLSRGLEMNDGRRLGIDYGGPGELHMLTDSIGMGDSYVPIHVDGDSIYDVRLKFKAAVVEAARMLIKQEHDQRG